MHDAGIIAIPAVIVLIGILFNRHDAGEIRKDIAAKYAEVLARFSGVKSDLKTFNFLTGKLEGRYESLEKRVESFAKR